MKKIVSMIVCLILSMNIAYASTEADVMEMLEATRLSPTKDANILENLYKANQQKIEDDTNLYLIAPGYAREKIGISADDEKMKKQVLERYQINENKIFKTYYLNNRLYAKQYTEQCSLKYLISSDFLWLSKVDGWYRAYEMTGDWYDYDIDRENILGSKLFQDDTAEYLISYDKIYELVKDIDISTIVDIKLVMLTSMCPCIYIDCATNEYLIRVRVGKFNQDGVTDYWVKSFEPFILYDAKEALNLISTETTFHSMNSQKQTFEQEAQALQTSGLLYGNENGLDLLKPLTRIEAATMLLRAMGESTVATTDVQTFSDVPSTHWGYGAAENAYSLGLIKGIGDDLFAPDDMVTGAQFATMVLRASNYPDFNWEEAMNILIENGIISEEDASTMDFFTRGDMAKIIYESLEKELF